MRGETVGRLTDCSTNLLKWLPRIGQLDAGDLCELVQAWDAPLEIFGDGDCLADGAAGGLEYY